MMISLQHQDLTYKTLEVNILPYSDYNIAIDSNSGHAFTVYSFRRADEHSEQHSHTDSYLLEHAQEGECVIKNDPEKLERPAENFICPHVEALRVSRPVSFIYSHKTYTIASLAS